MGLQIGMYTFSLVRLLGYSLALVVLGFLLGLLTASLRTGALA